MNPWHCTLQPPLATELRLLQARAAPRCLRCGLFVCPSVRPSSVRCRLVCSPLPRWVLGAFFCTHCKMTTMNHSSNPVKKATKRRRNTKCEEPTGSYPRTHLRKTSNNMQNNEDGYVQVYTRQEKEHVQFGSPSRHSLRACKVRPLWNKDTEVQSTTSCGSLLYT